MTDILPSGAGQDTTVFETAAEQDTETTAGQILCRQGLTLSVSLLLRI